MKRGARLLRRNGATRAQIRAFNLEPRWPEVRDPAHDAVLDVLIGAPERQSPDEGGRREPWAAP